MASGNSANSGLDPKALLAAIVDSSDDAIVSKDLDGTVTSWNRGAERLFGYTAAEMVGHPLRVIAVPGSDEMPRILERIRQGERIEHYETTRRRKDGSFVSISLTVSPIRDGSGKIIGASKIARDIGERKRAEERQQLLIAELNHRVKNTMATVLSIVAQTGRTASDPQSFVRALQGRLSAMANTHDLLAAAHWSGADLDTLIATELQPYRGTDASNVVVLGPPISVNASAALSLAMVLHELATNAAKHGALSTPEGRVQVTWEIVESDGEDRLRLVWDESGGPMISAPTRSGFGRTLIERSVVYQLEGRATQEFRSSGLLCRMEIPLASLTGRSAYTSISDRIEEAGAHQTAPSWS